MVPILWGEKQVAQLVPLVRGTSCTYKKRVQRCVHYTILRPHCETPAAIVHSVSTRRCSWTLPTQSECLRRPARANLTTRAQLLSDKRGAFDTPTHHSIDPAPRQSEL